MHMMKMAIMKIIDMAIMFDSRVPTIRAVFVRVILVFFAV
jgi:hypothetical protein